MEKDGARADLAAYGLTEGQLALLNKLSPRMKSVVIWQLGHWPGRIALRVASGLRRIQVFDRAMTIAAQLFTSVFPILIMGAAFFGAHQVSTAISSVGGLPPETQQILDEVAGGTSSSTFGVIGALVVLVSATSLSRALIRAYASVWLQDHSPTKLNQAWRWFVVVIGLALALVVTQRLITLLEPIPPQNWWAALVVLVVNTAIATGAPWLLLAGRLKFRRLLPGGLLFAIGMALAHPVSSRYLPASIEASAARFGSIGVAFTYLTYLFAVSWLLLATAVVGQVIATDDGPFGRFVRGTERKRAPQPPRSDGQ